MGAQVRGTCAAFCSAVAGTAWSPADCGGGSGFEVDGLSAVAAGMAAAGAAETFARHLIGVDGDHYLETGHRDRRRIFNLGYFTWVEQRGVDPEVFDRRAAQRFWKGVQEVLPVWDEMIDDFNARTGV